ncbi:Methyltransferase type 11 [Pyrobaculum neutrophilum V24Sta]|uniref:Methyltransferase type 11 n=1 Tax=Pyrobaculum neutrophilum (strain DSM 2338 / JCM 9278 / NBRC 100436 / V24Sta) TaxID=444157 RepID=B1Y9H6_PYRNV|nr:Methyltransferase type 11 [Pyrobaculum neutrophilum V24Sta]
MSTRHSAVGLGQSWHYVREAYRRIWRAYERANLVATLGGVDRWRREAVSLYYRRFGESPLKVVDAGAGPGNMARCLKGIRYVVALDATPEMLSLNAEADEKIVGIFEQMPFRDGSFDLLVAGYSLHASIDIERATAEFARVAKHQVVVSIGKPDNKLARRLLLLYTKHVLPWLVCLFTPRDVCLEYKKIHTIVQALPTNSKLREVVERYAEVIDFRVRAWGAVYLYLASSRLSSTQQRR